MPETQTPPQQQRGAGTGEKANATRSRNIVDWPPEPKPHAEHVDELEAERDAQADFNNEMHELQVNQIKAFTEKVRKPVDLEENEEVREEAKEAFEAATDPKKKESALKGDMEARAKRDKAAAAAQQGQK